MELLSHDILIVGGGGAGLRAAIAIGEENPDLSVGVVSKVYPMRSHTVSAEGPFMGTSGDEVTSTGGYFRHQRSRPERPW